MIIQFTEKIKTTQKPIQAIQFNCCSSMFTLTHHIALHSIASHRIESRQYNQRAHLLHLKIWFLSTTKKQIVVSSIMISLYSSKFQRKERRRERGKKGIAFLIVPYSAAVPEHCCTNGKAIAFNAANEVKLSTNQLISQWMCVYLNWIKRFAWIDHSVSEMLQLEAVRTMQSTNALYPIQYARCTCFPNALIQQ